VLFVNFSSNGLIFQLSDEDRHRLQQICQPVALAEGQNLCLAGADDADQIYFLTGACVTLWVQAEHKKRLAVSVLGSESALGLGMALGQNTTHLRYEVQRAGAAWRTPSVPLQQLLQAHPSMLWTVARYLWQTTHDIAQMAASVQYDDVPTRLAAWLVLCAQRSGSLQLNLTHEQLAHMLGVRRVSITLAAVSLKEAGLLNYKRGSMDILDLKGLTRQAQGGKPA
jgi:CRP-like cAMP-binding protein